MIYLVFLIFLCVHLFILACSVCLYIKQYKMIVAFLHNTQPLVNVVHKFSNDERFEKLKNYLSNYEKAK